MPRRRSTYGQPEPFRVEIGEIQITHQDSPQPVPNLHLRHKDGQANIWLSLADMKLLHDQLADALGYTERFGMQPYTVFTINTENGEVMSQVVRAHDEKEAARLVDDAPSYTFDCRKRCILAIVEGAVDNKYQGSEFAEMYNDLPIKSRTLEYFREYDAQLQDRGRSSPTGKRIDTKIRCHHDGVHVQFGHGDYPHGECGGALLKVEDGEVVAYLVPSERYDPFRDIEGQDYDCIPLHRFPEYQLRRPAVIEEEAA